LGQHIDKLIRAKTGLKGRKNKDKRHRISQKINRLFIRIKNLIDEVHKKAAKWLTTGYRVIFIPTFESSQMVAKSGKKKRKLNSKTVRQIRSLGTLSFQKNS
jgi:putative transposase